MWEELLQEGFEELTSLQRFLHGHLLRTPAGQEVWTQLPVISESVPELAHGAVEALEAGGFLDADLAVALVSVRPRSAERVLTALRGGLNEAEAQRLRAVANDRCAELEQLESPDPRWLDAIRQALHAVAEQMQGERYLHRIRKTTQVQDGDLLRRSQRYFSERLRRIIPRLFAAQPEMAPPLAAFCDAWFVGQGQGALSERLSQAISRWMVENMAFADQLRALETASGLASGSWSVGGLERETAEFVNEMVERRIRGTALEIQLQASTHRIRGLEDLVRRQGETLEQQRAALSKLRDGAGGSGFAEGAPALEHPAAGLRALATVLLAGGIAVVCCIILYWAVSAEIALTQQELQALHEALP